MPDQPATSKVLSEATNCVPMAEGYGPFNSAVAFTDALPAPFAGGGSFIGADGTSALLAGTTEGLYRYSGGAWIELVAGMSVTGRWRFVQFGDYVVAVNGSLTQVVTLASGSPAASDLTGSPNGVCAAVVGDYVVIGQDSNDLNGIYTSGFNDHTDWNPAGTGGATIQPMLSGGEVMGLAGGEYGVILQRQRLMRMTRTGDATAPFQYDEITSNVGCSSRASVVQVGRTVFFRSDRGFMALDEGQAIRPIGSERIDRTFSAALDGNSEERLFAAYDPVNKLVMWCIPGAAGVIYSYHLELDRWTTASLPVDGIFSGFAPAMTLEEVAALYPVFDGETFSLDDARFSGTTPRIYACYARKACTLSGPALAAAWQFGFDQFSGGRLSRFRAVRPVTDCTVGNAVSIDTRARPGDAANTTAASALRTSGIMPIRCSGRFSRVRWQIAAGSEWTYATALELEYEAGGER